MCDDRLKVVCDETGGVMEEVVWCGMVSTGELSHEERVEMGLVAEEERCRM